MAGIRSPDCDDNIVGEVRLFLPRYELNGRAAA
jgi:hypothetical protein